MTEDEFYGRTQEWVPVKKEELPAVILKVDPSGEGWEKAAPKEFTKDSADNVKAGAIKYDAGKAPIFRGGLAYFPRAIAAVSEVSNFGASKYAWKGWENVPDGVARYSDALVRHLAYEGKGEVLDPDSGLLHAAHCAWNSLARLELMLKDKEQLELWAQSPEAQEIVDQINGDPYLKAGTDAVHQAGG